MNLLEIFEHFAADFELSVGDDDWSSLEKYFADDASYQNIGVEQPKYVGTEAILKFLQEDVSNIDRRFDNRKLDALTEPEIEDNQLSRKWRITYTLENTPDLVVEGEARYQFQGELIKGIEEEVTPESIEKLTQWMDKFGEKLTR